MACLKVLTAIMAISCLLSCSPWREKPKEELKSVEPPRLESASTLTLVPLVDGGIYAVNDDCAVGT